MTLTEFLLARIEDDAYLNLGYFLGIGLGDGTTGVVRESLPKRWEVEREAKRMIVERHRPFSHGRCQACYHLEDQDEWTANVWPCPDLRTLALPYFEHPDYREEWRP